MALSVYSQLVRNCPPDDQSLETFVSRDVPPNHSKRFFILARLTFVSATFRFDGYSKVEIFSISIFSFLVYEVAVVY